MKFNLPVILDFLKVVRLVLQVYGNLTFVPFVHINRYHLKSVFQGRS